MANELSFDQHTSHNGLESRNVLAEKLSSPPSSPVAGRFYYDTSLNQLGYHNGSSWVYTGSAPNLSAYLTETNTKTISNKTIDAAVNTISNLDTTMFASGVIDNSPLMGGGSPSSLKLPTQSAVSAFVIDKVTGLYELKGAIDASTNPNYPAADKGDAYRISVAGKIGGASGVVVAVGDTIVAHADSVAGAQGAVGANWVITERNADQATELVLGLIKLATQAEVTAGTVNDKAVTPATLGAALTANGFTKKYTGTHGDGSSTTLLIQHQRGTEDLVYKVYDISTTPHRLMNPGMSHVNSNEFNLYFGTAPATNSIRVTVIA